MDEKPIYQYHLQTGEFLFTGIADSSPLEEGVWLIPAYATPTTPLETGMHEAAVYRDADGNVPTNHDDGEWRVVSDWRGVPLWSTTTGEPMQIDIIGVAPADIGATDIERTELTTTWDGTGWVVDAALIARRLSARQEAMLADISAERDRREESGFPYRGKVLDSTPRSVQRITAAALAAQAALAAGQPFLIDWTCADNSALPLDATGVIGMPVALAQYAAALHAHSRALKATVEAAADQAALDAIDIQAGWPGGGIA